MIELPRNRPVTKPFDPRSAKQGAPIVTTLGFPVRIICWNKITGDKYDDIVALVQRNQNSEHEDVVVFQSDGKGMGNNGALGDLAMASICTVEGKAMFEDDQVFGLLGKPVEINVRDHGHFKGKEVPGLKLKPPPVRFEGKWIDIDSKIWYRPAGDHSWQYLRCGDNWNINPGAVESHFEYIKRNEGRPMCLHFYTSKCPYDLTVEGTEIKVGDVLWYKERNDKVIISERNLDALKSGQYSVELFTRRAPVKFEQWQVKARPPKAPLKASIFVGKPFFSQKDCEELGKDEIPEGYTYVGSEKVSEYYA